MDIEPFLYYFVITKTPNLSNAKLKWAYLNQYPPRDNRKDYMGQWYQHSTRWEQYIVAVIHIYWARSLSLLLCDPQATETESREIEISRSQPIFSHKIYQRLYGETKYILYNIGETNCGTSSYLWSFSHFPTILWWPRHWIWVMWNENFYSWTNIDKKTPKALWDIDINNLQTGWNYCSNSSYFGARAILLLCVHQDTESE